MNIKEFNIYYEHLDAFNEAFDIIEMYTEKANVKNIELYGEYIFFTISDGVVDHNYRVSVDEYNVFEFIICLFETESYKDDFENAATLQDMLLRKLDTYFKA